MLYGTAYETELERMQTQIDRFRQMLEHRAAVAIDQATERSRIWRTLSEIMVGLTALMFLFVLGFILKRRVLYPVVRLSDVVQRLASRIMRWRRRTLPRWMRLVTWLRRSAFSRERPGPSAAGAAARRRLGDPRAAGAYDSAAAGL